MSKRILVVDDEESIRFTFEAFLTGADYCVDTAASLPDALQRVGEQEYDLIFLDILLGRESGMEVLKFIHDHNPNCPVIMVTGAPDVTTAAEAVRLGAYDYLTKPVHQGELLRVARQAIEHKTLRDQQETYRLRMAAVFDSINEGILVFDDQNCLVEINASARRMLACGFDLVGKTVEQISSGCGCQMVRGLNDLVAQRCMGEIYRMETVNGAGESLVFSLTMAPLTGHTGRETGVVLVLRDESLSAAIVG
jgi:DNA-binding response OmpR family regulator